MKFAQTFAQTFVVGQPFGSNPFLCINYFPTPFRISVFSKRRSWYPSILNWLSVKVVSSLVLSMQSIFILDVEIISLKQMFFAFKEFKLSWVFRMSFH